MTKRRKTYLILTVVLFTVEVLIAVFVHDRYVRPYVGDFLVVILIYCFIRGLFNIPIRTSAIATLLFAYMIEVLQYFKIVELVGLGDSKVGRVIIGSSFEWIDMVAYTLGIVTVLLIEWALPVRRKEHVHTA